jgi:hypothetical protein
MRYKRFPIAAFVAIALFQINTLRAYDTLVYKSAYEQKIVKGAVNQSNSDFFALYLAISSDSGSYEKYASSLNNFYRHLDSKLSKVKADKQRAKIVFKEVHEYFFTKYEEHVLFNQIFETGSYNCLTASMLYAIILDKVGLPYEIKEKPTHIYLVAFPGTDNILFETTDPRGLFVPDDKTKRQYVAGLITMKLTTQEYVNSVGLAKAFNEFYYNNQNITLQQLAGLQYFNDAIALYDAQKMSAAIISTLKAYLLYPSTKNEYLKTSLIKEALGNSNFESLTDIIYLAEYANAAKDNHSKKFVLSVFSDVLSEKLFKSGQDAFVTDANKIMQERVKDESVKKDINYSYQLAMGDWYSMKGDLTQSLRYAESAYALNPDDARLQGLIVKAIGMKSERVKGKAEAIEGLQAYAEKYPFLKSNKTFSSLLVFQYAFRSYSLFSQNAGPEGDKYRELMEEELKKMEGNSIMMDQLIGMVYAEAGAFHYRQKHLYHAKEILLKGLEVVPGHTEIMERLKIVEAELK